MGILLDVDRSEAISNAVADLKDRAGSSNPTRVVIIQVYNHIDRPLRLRNRRHEAGTFGEPPSQEIPAGKVDIFSSRRRSWRPEGAIGRVSYDIENRVADSPVIAVVEWRNRYLIGRGNSSNAWFTAGGPPWPDQAFRDRLEITNDIGGGSTAYARYEIWFKEERGSRGGRSTGGIGSIPGEIARRGHEAINQASQIHRLSSPVK